MRRKPLILLVAAVVLALVVPIGTALTLDRSLDTHPRVTAAIMPVLPLSPGSRPFAEAGSLLLAGALLIALGSVVRRTS